MQIILQTSGKSIKEDMALLLGWGGREKRNVWSELVFCSMARPDLRNTFRERGVVWLPGVVFIGIQRSETPKENLILSPSRPHLHAMFVSAIVILTWPISKLSKHTYGSEFLPPPTIKTKEKLLPLHKISLARELVLGLSRWLKWKIEFSQWATNKWILMNTEIHSLTNKRANWIERQSRCV